MLKIMAILTLFFIARTPHHHDSKVPSDNIEVKYQYLSGGLAGRSSCNSCGRECAPACGTRYFRSCCFNYLRKKRGSDSLQAFYENLQGWKPEGKDFEDRPEMWSVMPSDFALYHLNDKFDNTLHNV